MTDNQANFQDIQNVRKIVHEALSPINIQDADHAAKITIEAIKTKDWYSVHYALDYMFAQIPEHKFDELFTSFNFRTDASFASTTKNE